MLDRGTVVAQRRGAAHGGTLLRRHGVDRLAPNAIVLAAGQSLIRARRHALLIGTHELELERRGARVEHENVHQGCPAGFSRAAADRARVSASSAVSP